MTAAPEPGVSPLDDVIDGQLAAMRDELVALSVTHRRQEASRRQLLQTRVRLLKGRLSWLANNVDVGVGGADLTPRARAGAALRWVMAMWRDQRKLLEEIRLQIHDDITARERFARDVEARMRRLEQTARQLGAAAERALRHDPSAAPRVDPRAQALEARVAASYAAIRARQDAAIAQIRRAALRATSNPLPERRELTRRFSAALQELGGDAPTPAPRKRQRRRSSTTRAAARSRKFAKIPKFVLRRFYVKGSLTRTADGFTFRMFNPAAFAIVDRGDPVIVDTTTVAPEATWLSNGESEVRGDALSPENKLKFFKKGEITIRCAGHTLRAGPHRLTISVELRKIGWVALVVEDTVS